jgi:mycothiol synthase
MTDASQPARIEPLGPDDWTAALERALARVPEAERPGRLLHCLHLMENGILDPRGVWVARVRNEIVATQVCVPLAGAACLFWLPANDNAVADALIRACMDWAVAAGCKLGQALVRPDELAAAEPLLRCGFARVTCMHHLAHDLADVPNEKSQATFVNYVSASPQIFADTLERTYAGTLDCPELNGTRTIDEIITGHRGQGRFHPELWWLGYQDGVPFGVVLLSEMPDRTTWELAYLGVVPEFRGRRLGRTLTLHALHAVYGQLGTRLLLAVDERNAPARRLYQSLGFVLVESNEVLLYFFAR